METTSSKSESSTFVTVRVRTILTLKNILGKGEFELLLPQGSTLDDLLSSLIHAHGEKLSSYLFNTEGKGGGQRAYVTRIMINGQDIEFLNGLETVLHEKDEVLILPVVSGG